MTLETNITTILRMACSRVFPDFAPTNTARPYVTYQQIGGEAPTFLDGTVPSKENAVIQVNVWSDTRKEAKAMIKQIEEVLTAATMVQAKPIGASVSDFEADIPVYGSRQDFSVWCDR